MTTGKNLRQDASAVLCVLAAMLAVMMFTGYWPVRPNEYNSYTLQACAWLEGRLDLGQTYSHLEIAEYGGKYYVSFPPFPSCVMLPFALLLGEKTPDAAIALLVTMIGVLYALRLYRSLCPDRHGLFWILFLYLGTGYIFLAVNGYVWFFAQTMCFTLSLMSLYYTVQGKGGLSLTAWACAVGCRPMVLLYFPLLLSILQRSVCCRGPLRSFLLRKWYWAAGPLLLGSFYMILNGLRFGDILEFGHSYLPEFLRAPEGQFSLSYFRNNFATLFRLPAWNGKSAPLSFCTFNGMAVWFVNPMSVTAAATWIYALRNKVRENVRNIALIPILTAAYIFVLCCHRTMGGWQFGSRYLLDVMPWLFYGLTEWKPASDRFVLLNLPLYSFGLSLNLIGTVSVYNHWI